MMAVAVSIWLKVGEGSVTAVMFHSVWGEMEIWFIQCGGQNVGIGFLWKSCILILKVFSRE